MTTPDSPAVRKARRCARNPVAYPSLSAKHVAEVLAELDEARRDAWINSDESRMHVEALRAARDEARAALATLPEWTCPSCGATTRARMADRAPRVWLEGDELPAGVHVTADGVDVWFTDEARETYGDLVEVLVPDYAAAVAAERERRAAVEAAGASGEAPPPNPAPEPSEGRSGELGRQERPSAWQLPRGVQVHSVAAASLSPQLAQSGQGDAAGQSVDTREPCPDDADGEVYFADLVRRHGRCTCPVEECAEALPSSTHPVCALCAQLDLDWPCPTVEHRGYEDETGEPS